MKRPLPAAAAIALALVGGCASHTEPAAATVEVGDAHFAVEVASTATQQREGLAARSELDEDTGMLFPLESGQHQVWMAGMKVGLDVAWIAKGRVLEVLTLAPCTEADQDRCPRWTSPRDVDTLLEVPVGALNGVVAGDSVTVTTAS